MEVVDAQVFALSIVRTRKCVCVRRSAKYKTSPLDADENKGGNDYACNMQVMFRGAVRRFTILMRTASLAQVEKGVGRGNLRAANAAPHGDCTWMSQIKSKKAGARRCAYKRLTVSKLDTLARAQKL
jgi:hypothetical protein